MFFQLNLFLVIFGLIPNTAVNSEMEWPCFHGLQRDNISLETGLLTVWPEDGPPLVWTATDIGNGYSSVAVTEDRILTAGMIDKETYVIALDLDGKRLWRRPNGISWQASERQTWAVPYAGSRATPTVDGETVFHLGELGSLTAFDIGTGKVRWHLDLIETFSAERPEYGYSESVLIYGDRLFCCPAGREGYIVALDKNTGKTLWTNKTIKDEVGNSSSIIAEIDGVEQLIGLSAVRIFAVDPGSGRLLWQYEFGNSRGNNVTDVIVHENFVYASSGYGKGSVLVRPQIRNDGSYSVETRWSSELLDNHHGGVLLCDGYLYGAGHESRGWTCLDLLSGEKMWQSRGKGSLTYADGHLYCLDEKGLMSLVRATSEKYDVVSSFRVPRGGSGAYWAHPVVCGGRLYVRHSEKLYAYQIRPD